jgi:Ca-activated chloride channel family protein
MRSPAIGVWVIGFSSLLLAISPARADKPMALETRLGQPVMKSGEQQRNFLRIALNGCERQKTDRTPVNVAFVVDRSGSMQGFRIAQAREAAVTAVKRLDRNDIASVVIFDNQIDVLVAAQAVADHATFTDRIRQVDARGSTAIYDAVRKGADEVRRFKDNRRLNRVVLLSDGLANVGPSRPEDFARLGRDLLAEGISVSTIGLGLGYNEDLMLHLARASDGNHAFVSDAADLIQIFNKEFDDVLASCAQTVSIDVELFPGVRAVRALSRDGSIAGQHAQFRLNQIYQATEHYVLLELEVDKERAAGEQDLGRVRVAYVSPHDGSRQSLEAAISGRFTLSEADAKASRDSKVLESVVEQTTRERAAAAIKLRDQGKHEEARALLRENSAEISAYAASAPALSERLQYLRKEYDAIANTPTAAAPAQWNSQRKLLRQLDAAQPGAGVRY